MAVVLIIFFSIMFVSFVTGIAVTMYEKEQRDKSHIVKTVVEEKTIEIPKNHIQDDIEELTLSIPTIEPDYEDDVYEEPVIIEVLNKTLEFSKSSSLFDEELEII